MIPNNNISPLPWYLHQDEQLHRRTYSYGAIYPLYCQIDVLMPFQIVRETRENDITRVFLYDTKDRFVMNITQKMLDVGLRIKKYTDYGYDVILFPAVLPMGLNMEEGQYYLIMSDGQQQWYSEVFTVVTQINDFLKLEWYDAEDLFYPDGVITYKEPKYINRLYLQTQLGKPEYPFEEEGENRDGLFFPTKQIAEKTYRFTIIASEFLLDCLRIVRMSDYVKITDQYSQEYNADTFLMTPTWQTQGDLASCECEFQTSTIYKKIGRGYIVQDLGDFNIDFNNDYLITNE